MESKTNNLKHVANRNVTFDPLAPAIPVKKPAITELLDLDTGEFIDTVSYIENKRYEEIVAARLNIRAHLSERPRFACALCATPVYLVSNQLKHFFFRHKSEDGSCPAETRSDLSRDEICARKYHGLRESAAHRKIKHLIERSLAADKSFTDVATEKQWRSSSDAKNRRQPDVQANGPMGRIAFEAQLSTTFLDVVVDRRSFYRQEGALLIWVMGRFDPDYRRMTTDDLLFSNNSNIFVVDEETARISEASGQLCLRCHYRVPERSGNQLADRWEMQVVSFGNLTCEQDSQRAWYFDYEGNAAPIRERIEHDQRHRHDALLRERFTRFWMMHKSHETPHVDLLAEWQTLRGKFTRHNIELPVSPHDDSNLAALLNGVFSAKAGKPIGWSFEKLIQVAHRIADGYPQHIAAFGFALREFNRNRDLDDQDKTGKWQQRRTTIRAAIEKQDTAFMPDADTIPLIAFLFPQIGEKLQKLAERFRAK